MGRFSDDDRISDPRGLVLHPVSGLVDLNSGPDRILALNQAGVVTRDSGVSMVLTQAARSLDPKVACTSRCGVGEP